MCHYERRLMFLPASRGTYHRIICLSLAVVALCLRKRFHLWATGLGALMLLSTDYQLGPSFGAISLTTNNHNNNNNNSQQHDGCITRVTPRGYVCFPGPHSSGVYGRSPPGLQYDQFGQPVLDVCLASIGPVLMPDPLVRVRDQHLQPVEYWSSEEMISCIQA